MTEQKQTPKNTYNVTVKRVPTIQVASLTQAVPDFESSSGTNIYLFDTIRERMAAADRAYSNVNITLYHGIPNVTELALECAIQIDAMPEDTDAVEVDFKSLPAVEQMASITHHGSFQGYGTAFETLMTWVRDNGYQIIGATRDIYHVFDKDGDPDTFVTEIQFPIAPVGEMASSEA